MKHIIDLLFGPVGAARKAPQLEAAVAQHRVRGKDRVAPGALHRPLVLLTVHGPHKPFGVLLQVKGGEIDAVVENADVFRDVGAVLLLVKGPVLDDGTQHLLEAAPVFEGLQGHISEEKPLGGGVDIDLVHIIEDQLGVEVLLVDGPEVFQDVVQHPGKDLPVHGDAQEFQEGDIARDVILQVIDQALLPGVQVQQPRHLVGVDGVKLPLAELLALDALHKQQPHSPALGDLAFVHGFHGCVSPQRKAAPVALLLRQLQPPVNVRQLLVQLGHGF